MQYQPAQVAQQLGVSAFTVRRWCEWHSDHLSPGANPAPGRPRKLDERDIEVLRHVAQLRSKGLQTAEINAQLASMVFAVPVSQDAPPDAPDSILAASAPNVGIDSQTALQAIVGRLDAIERTQRDKFTWFLFGFLACGVLFALFLLLALLFRG